MSIILGNKKKIIFHFGLSLLVMFSLSLQAQNSSYYGIIQDIEGVAFVSDGEKTVEASVGMRVFDHTEIMTTAGSQVTFMDRYDHLFHLSSSGHVKVFNQIVELKRGYLWFQSMRKTNDSFALETANSQVIYQQGEGILSFDEVNGKSQFLSVRGQFLFGNTIQDHFVETVREGQFSFIEDEFQGGRPRSATPVGYSSYQRVTGLFHNVEPLEGELQFPELESDEYMASRAEPVPRRGVASQEEAPKVEKSRKGKITILRNSKEHRKSLREYYSSQLQLDDSKSKESQSKELPSRSVASESKPESFRPQYNRKSKVEVRVFGQAKEDKENQDQRERTPASVGIETSSSDLFEECLSREYENQQRHSDEVNSLIRDLRNYQRDYKTSY